LFRLSTNRSTLPFSRPALSLTPALFDEAVDVAVLLLDFGDGGFAAGRVFEVCLDENAI
jgi:hypothetical protein